MAPVGLEGEQKRKALVRGVMRLSSWWGRILKSCSWPQRKGAEEESLGAWSDEAFELVGQNLEVLLLAAKEGYVDAFCQFYHFEIAHPCRGGDDYFVALVNDGENDIADLLLGTITYNNLCRREIYTILTFEFSANGLTEGHIARHRCVE